MAARAIPGIAVALVALLVAASPAAAADGIGLYGPADDRVVTFFGFGVIILFAVLVIGLSIAQHRLETRKERARQSLERLQR